MLAMPQQPGLHSRNHHQSGALACTGSDMHRMCSHRADHVSSLRACTVVKSRFSCQVQHGTHSQTGDAMPLSLHRQGCCPKLPSTLQPKPAAPGSRTPVSSTPYSDPHTRPHFLSCFSVALIRALICAASCTLVSTADALPSSHVDLTLDSVSPMCMKRRHTKPGRSSASLRPLAGSRTAASVTSDTSAPGSQCTTAGWMICAGSSSSLCAVMSTSWQEPSGSVYCSSSLPPSLSLSLPPSPPPSAPAARRSRLLAGESQVTTRAGQASQS
mmetsp:Transcript_3096/g.7759  ORF Transcript_3096/g.7759 Transcript_3096/m.7759 type:complete len:271 (+) Transcript_3096:357-1169(+)